MRRCLSRWLEPEYGLTFIQVGVGEIRHMSLREAEDCLGLLTSQGGYRVAASRNQDMMAVRF
jgi:hypothetical protein